MLCFIGQFLPRAYLPQAVSMNRKRCNHYRLIVACILSGASQDRPVIVGWSTAPRGLVDCTSWSGHRGEVLGNSRRNWQPPARAGKDRSITHQSGTKQGGPPHDHWAKWTNSVHSNPVCLCGDCTFLDEDSSRRHREKRGGAIGMRPSGSGLPRSRRLADREGASLSDPAGARARLCRRRHIRHPRTHDRSMVARAPWSAIRH